MPINTIQEFATALKLHDHCQRLFEVFEKCLPDETIEGVRVWVFQNPDSQEYSVGPIEVMLEFAKDFRTIHNFEMSAAARNSIAYVVEGAVIDQLNAGDLGVQWELPENEEDDDGSFPVQYVDMFVDSFPKPKISLARAIIFAEMCLKHADAGE